EGEGVRDRGEEERLSRRADRMEAEVLVGEQAPALGLVVDRQAGQVLGPRVGGEGQDVAGLAVEDRHAGADRAAWMVRLDLLDGRAEGLVQAELHLALEG